MEEEGDGATVNRVIRVTYGVVNILIKKVENEVVPIASPAKNTLPLIGRDDSRKRKKGDMAVDSAREDKENSLRSLKVWARGPSYRILEVTTGRFSLDKQDISSFRSIVSPMVTVSSREPIVEIGFRVAEDLVDDDCSTASGDAGETEGEAAGINVWLEWIDLVDPPPDSSMRGRGRFLLFEFANVGGGGGVVDVDDAKPR